MRPSAFPQINALGAFRKLSNNKSCPCFIDKSLQGKFRDVPAISRVATVTCNSKPIGARHVDRQLINPNNWSLHFVPRFRPGTNDEHTAGLLQADSVQTRVFAGFAACLLIVLLAAQVVA